ncbi:MAG: glycine cleavage system aminomethyltransferase GcvT [Bacillota bacterium]
MKYTPFYDRHVQNKAKMVEFTGYSLPMQFKGIISEHNSVRQTAGLFDVSHMGEFLITGKNAFKSIQYIITNDITSLQGGKARYTLMANPQGGVVDDILVYKFNDEKYMLVVNAANSQKDADWVKKNLLPDTCFENISDKTCQLALQGPESENIMKEVFEKDIIPEKYFSFLVGEYRQEQIIISRTGYTGEDGFEIYSGENIAMQIYDDILEKRKKYRMELCGLGARDTLRIEAAMPLYGHEMNEKTLASEIDLGFAIKMNKENFIGKDALLENAPQYKRIGLKLIERGIAREKNPVYDGDKKIGFVTSGTYSPTLGYPIAMARVEKGFSEDELFVEVRNKKIRAEVVPLPFYKRK